MPTKKKYWWFCYVYPNAGGGKTYCDDTSLKHSFFALKEMVARHKWPSLLPQLINWKEITAEEYDMYHSTVEELTIKEKANG